MRNPEQRGSETTATIQTDATVAEAARRMRDLHVGHLVVVGSSGDKTAEVGLLSDSDIVAGLVTLGAPLLARRTVGELLGCS
jgi:predicted transcriptional regulator